MDIIKRATFEAASKVGRCNLEDTVVISGSPRSGTTWLLELLRKMPDYKALNEPLMYEEARDEHGFSWRTHISPDEEAPKQEDYIREILSGRMGISPAWYFEADSRPEQLIEHAARKKLVVKFCRLNRMLHWFTNRFEVRGVIFIVRHPCAVVASMIKHGAWDEERLQGFGDQSRQQALHGAEKLPFSDEDDLGAMLDGLTTREEILAAMWALDHYLPLVAHAKNHFPWILVPYERLVTRGRAEVERVVDALGLDATPEMFAQLDEPSSSVKDKLHLSAKRQLSKWQRQLSPTDIDAVLRVVDHVGLSAAYTDAIEPDYEWLNARQKPAYRW